MTGAAFHLAKPYRLSYICRVVYPLSRRFAIHPRPFDRLLAIALEIFTRASSGKEHEELWLVAEYLGFFLGGPFDAPRKHVGTLLRTQHFAWPLP